ncbi:hypothetical protein CORC01_12745 [Colletotrichum orchidophilum]|uniref:BZIP domain-containing protein n=1 Tax=Colletotrichum orchidophilum TaxID=1209926 RepID=A0A1G4AS09_9PEZI|nr:uncharacterized protein CORC01_12745 [Colletotrichum orchidophilum]OHE91957.1 hypothetical protein CORC01_12745 [Colletotrichum orchidophilum]
MIGVTKTSGSRSANIARFPEDTAAKRPQKNDAVNARSITASSTSPHHESGKGLGFQQKIYIKGVDPLLVDNDLALPLRIDHPVFASSSGPEDRRRVEDRIAQRRVQNRIAQRNYRKKLKERLEELERRAGFEGETWSSTDVIEHVSYYCAPLPPVSTFELKSREWPEVSMAFQNPSSVHLPTEQDLCFARIADESDDKNSSLSEASEAVSTSTLPPGHRFRSTKQQLVKDCLLSFAEWQQCPQNSNKRTANPSASQAQKSSKRAKRSEEEKGKNDDEANDEDEDSNAKAAGASAVIPLEKTKSIIFACPFYKEDPLRHLQCLRIELKRIKDVKQHLNRKHRQPSYYYRRLSEEQQWFTVWDIMFPNVPRPDSAYLGNQIEESMVMIHDFWDASGKALVSNALYQRGLIPDPYVPDEDVELESFLAETLESVVEELLVSCRTQIAANLARSNHHCHEVSLASERISTSDSGGTMQTNDTNEQIQQTVDSASAGERSKAQEKLVGCDFLTGLGLVEPLAGHDTYGAAEGLQFDLTHDWPTGEEGFTEFGDQDWELLAGMDDFLQVKN